MIDINIQQLLTSILNFRANDTQRDAILSVDRHGGNPTFMMVNMMIKNALKEQGLNFENGEIVETAPTPNVEEEEYESREIKSNYDFVKRYLAAAFMDYLDNNRVEGKMCLSNGECADIDRAFDEQDWAKVFRYILKYQRPPQNTFNGDKNE